MEKLWRHTLWFLEWYILELVGFAADYWKHGVATIAIATGISYLAGSFAGYDGTTASIWASCLSSLVVFVVWQVKALHEVYLEHKHGPRWRF